MSPRGLALLLCLASVKLYGTLTSPFVRRVRILAELQNTRLELVRTDTDEGQKALSAVTPLWKVPVLDTGDQVLFDSRVILEWLLGRFGEGGLRVASGPERYRDQNLLTVIDGALDAAINGFYFARDGVEEHRAPYLRKQRERVGSALSWVESSMSGPWLSDEPRLGLPEVALLTTLEWMTFRNAYDVRAHPGFSEFLAHHEGFAPFVATRPVAAQ